MISVEFDTKQMTQYAERLGASADQIPYALARSLNDGAEETRDALIAMWPRNVNARNSSFIAASLTTRGARATKHDLSVEIYDRLLRGNLKLHAEGGTRTAIHGANLAIGGRNVPRGAQGVPAGSRPRAHNMVRIGDVVYQVLGIGNAKRYRLKLMYVIKPQATIKKTVPFYETFAQTMRDALVKAVPGNVIEAMRTRIER